MAVAVTALGRRPVGAFFAAFYRWRCCLTLQHHHHYHPQHRHHLRPRQNHATRPLRQHPHASGATVADEDATQLQQSVRKLMRAVPSSVAVVTAAFVDENHTPQPLGLAVSSLNTVTLDPPTVSFNIKCPSQTLDAIRDAGGRFRVHFLAADTTGAQIVDLFTRGNHAEAFEARKQAMLLQLDADSKLSAPQIRHEAVVGDIECKLVQEVPVADHIIVVAKVCSLHPGTASHRSLVYLDGEYIGHGPDLQLAPESDADYIDIYWRYPLFPGEIERQDLIDRLKRFLKSSQNNHLLQKPTITAANELCTILNIPQGALGINLNSLIQECSSGTGIRRGSFESKRNPLTTEFYGRLTPTNIAVIGQRAVKLVEKDPSLLSLPCTTIFRHLDVYFPVSGLLASDILVLLRKAGLAGPCVPRPSLQDGRQGSPTLEDLEAVENKLRTYLESKPYNVAHRMSTIELLEAIREPSWMQSYVIHIRPRIHAEAAPTQFDDSQIDIRGEVTPEEALVVMKRILRFLMLAEWSSVYVRLAVPQWEMLRQVGVHPAVSGIDIDFFLGKLRYLHRTTRSKTRKLDTAVKQLLMETFKRGAINWFELKSRVKEFVTKCPLRATQWNTRDIQAAMGLGRCRVRPPISKRSRDIASLIPSLLTRELKNRYGQGTEEEDQAIANFLKEKHNYEIHKPPSRLKALESDSAELSSDRELEEAMKHHLNVNALQRRHAEHSEQRQSASLAEIPLMRKSMAGARVDKSHVNELEVNQKSTPIKDEGNDSLVSWTAYGLDGEIKL